MTTQPRVGAPATGAAGTSWRDESQVGRSNYLYDTSAHYEVVVRDVPYQVSNGVEMMARVYQPQGTGPFPMLIDIHGGGWFSFDRFRDEPIDTELAAHGLFVASLDFRTGSQAPYPADQVDINYGIRFFKAHAAEFNARADAIGAIGYSSGAHQVVLAGLKPNSPKYTAIGPDQFPGIDASLDFVISGSPPINLTRHQSFKTVQGLDLKFVDHFGSQANLIEASPYHIVVGAEEHAYPAILICHGWADKLCLPESVMQFADAYALKGGQIEVGLFPNTPHIFLNPGLVESTASTDRGLSMIKTYIARQVQHKLHPFKA